MICSILADILHIMAILMICKYYLVLDVKKRDIYNKIMLLFCISFFSIVIQLVTNVYIKTILYVICLLIVMWITFCERKHKLIVCTFWIMFLIEIVDGMFIAIMDILEKVLKCQNKQIRNLAVIIATLLLIYIIGKLISIIDENGLKGIELRYYIAFTIIIMADMLVLAMILMITLEEMAYRNKILYMSSYIAVTIGIFVQIAAVLFLLVSRNLHRENEKVIQQHLEEQVKHYEYLEIRERETKKFRHDIRNHLYFLNQLKTEARSDEFDKYFNEIIDSVDKLGERIDIGNDIVNAVLNKFYDEAAEKKIDMNVSGHFPAKCCVSAYNLCTVFFNLLKNAVEASEKAEKKEIWVICTHNESEIIIEIGNYYSGNIARDKDGIITTKSKKNYHGWGIKNVQDSIEKCRGMLDINVEGDKFVVNVTLWNNE